MSKNANVHISEKDGLKLDERQLKRIRDLIHKLKLECNLARAPMFVSFVKENTDKGTVYEHDMVFATTGTTLKDNRIGKLLLRINGYEAKLPKEVQDAVTILEEYIRKRAVSEIEEGQEIIEVELEDDMLSEFQDIIESDVEMFYRMES